MKGLGVVASIWEKNDRVAYCASGNCAIQPKVNLRELGTISGKTSIPTDCALTSNEPTKVAVTSRPGSGFKGVRNRYPSQIAAPI